MTTYFKEDKCNNDYKVQQQKMTPKKSNCVGKKIYFQTKKLPITSYIETTVPEFKVWIRRLHRQ